MKFEEVRGASQFEGHDMGTPDFFMMLLGAWILIQQLRNCFVVAKF